MPTPTATRSPASSRCFGDRTPEPTARWLHRGLTSQDVIDTALMLCVRDVLARIGNELASQVRTLSELAETHRDTPMVARTLTQAALPSTVGVKVAHWLSGVIEAAEPVAGLRASLPVQVGGAAGTLAAATELTGSVDGAIALSDALAAALRLAPAPPWHTTRSTVTRIGDALVTCCDAWGHIASDVATGSRPEIGELVEGEGGGSSTMPHKSNPIRSVLIRRAALTAGPLGATLHIAAAASVDERADGAWHAEWATLRTLARHTLVAAAHTSELLTGLRVDAARAAANLAAAGGLLSEQQTMTELTGRAAISGYTGVAEQLVDSRIAARPPLPQGHAMSIPRIIGTDFGGPEDTPLYSCSDRPWAPPPPHCGAKRRCELRRHVRVIAWDLPGHGTNGPAESFTMAELATGVLALADEFTAETFHYAGDSVGGCVGLQLLLNAPHRIASATLLCTGATIGTPDGWRERAASVRADGMDAALAGAAQRWFWKAFSSANRMSARRCCMPCATPIPSPTRMSVTPWRASTSPTGCMRSASPSLRSPVATTFPPRRSVCSA